MIGQLILIRVLMVIFYGNELTLAAVIAAWLVFEALGSYLGGRLSAGPGRAPSFFVGILLLYPVVLPAAIVLARLAGGGLLGGIPGEAMGLGHLALTAMIVTAPPGVMHGASFPLSAQLLNRRTAASSVGYAYVTEIAGAIAGGLVYVFILALRFTSLQVSFSLLVIHLVMCSWLTGTYASSGGARRVMPAFLAAAAALLAVFTPALTDSLQRYSLAALWPEGEIVDYANSPCGNIAVLEREEQHTVFYDGRPIISLPHPDTARLRDYAWLAALSHPGPRRALVLGGGLGGLLYFLLEHPLEKLVYTEMDPRLPEIVGKLDARIIRDELNDPRTRLVPRDGRLYLNRTRRKFDLIMIGTIDLDTLQANRFFTAELFRLARRRMNENGVLAFSMPGSPAWVGGELAVLNACLYNTAREVFEHVLPVPGEQNIMLASDGEITLEPATAARRMEERGLAPGMFTGTYLDYRLSEDRIEYLRSILEGTPARVNRDFDPAGFLYGLRYWFRAFAPRGLDALSGLRSVNLYWYAAFGIALIFAVRRLLFATPNQLANRLTFAIATSGVAAMSFDIFTMLAFQSLFGHIYQLNGLFIAAFMGGMFCGAWACRRRIRSSDDALPLLSLLRRLELAILALLIAFYGMFYVLRAGMALPAAAVFGAAAAVLYATAAGGVIGAQFPLAAALMPGGSWRDSAGRCAGRLYTADLAGGCIGGIMVALVLFPLLGLPHTLVLLAAVKLCSLALLPAPVKMRRTGCL